MAAEKKTEIIDGYTIKYHANGKTRWSRAKSKTASQSVTGSGTAWMAPLSAPDTSTPAKR